MKKTLLTVPVLALAMSGLADDPYADYIYLTKDDTSSKNSWNNTNTNVFKQGNWSEPFATDRNYYVPAGKTFYATGKPAGTWAGGELVIAGTMAAHANSSFDNAPTVSNLVFLGGSMLRSSSSYGLLRSSTRMTVLAPAENPLVIQMEYGDRLDYPVKLYADVHGDPGTGIRIQAKSTAVTNGFYFLTKTFEDFFGTLTVTGEKVNVMRPVSDNYYFTMPGKLVVTDSAVFMPSSDGAKTARENVLLGALEVKDDGVVGFRAQGDDAYVTLGITNSVRIADGGLVKVTNVKAANLVTRATNGAAADRRVAVRIANLSDDAADDIDVDEARVSIVNEGYDEAFNWKLIVQDKGDGTRDLYAGVTNIATIIKSHKTGPSLMTPDYWAGELPPTVGMDIYCAYRFNPFKDFDFSRSRLIFDSLGSHYWRGSDDAIMDLNAKDYYVVDSTSFTLWGGTNYRRRLRGGALHLADDTTFGFNFMDNCPSMRLESEIVGNGSLTFETHKDLAATYRATLENLNTNWHGRLTMAGFLDASYTYNTILGDARNWGGAFLADTNCYSAVTLVSNTCVYVTNNICFNDPTRGFLLKNAPGLMVKENFTLTLSNQVTYAGVVTKRGAGVLELGGTACFEDGQATTAPVAGNNVLIITNGTLKVSSRTACDGLAITFAEGTRLIVPAESTDGLFDVKWDAPLTVETTDGKIPVEIAVSGALPEGGFTTTLATLNATAAAQIPADTFKVAKVPGYTCTGVEKVATDDGVAYRANFEKRGLVIVVK